MPINFQPPLLNSANPWATSKKDLEDLFECPHTGAITTRTCLSGSNGFQHNGDIHQHCFVGDRTHNIYGHSQCPNQKTSTSEEAISSLNTYGYSPYPLDQYCQWVKDILIARKGQFPPKAIIISVASPDPESDLASLYPIIDQTCSSLSDDHGISCKFYMEINLSCPNIESKAPPAYSKTELLPYLRTLTSQLDRYRYFNGNQSNPAIECGIKLPPYTHQTQFDDLISALLASCTRSVFALLRDRERPITGTKPRAGPCPISFITTTNTLGSCLVLGSPAPTSASTIPTSNSNNTITPALNSATGTGIGGLAGAALHPLALGNVATLRRRLDEHDELKQIDIIGVGGVSDAAGYERMRAVGAAAVGVGTALGVHGVEVFERIWEGRL